MVLRPSPSPQFTSLSLENLDLDTNKKLTDADRKIRFKYPFASCEILCCEIDSVFSVLLGEGDDGEEGEEEGEGETKKEEA